MNLRTNYSPNTTYGSRNFGQIEGVGAAQHIPQQGYNINYYLKNIAEMVSITIPQTIYVTRHSWASAAKAKGTYPCQ